MRINFRIRVPAVAASIVGLAACGGGTPPAGEGGAFFEQDALGKIQVS